MKKHRIFTVILCFILLLTCLPLPALAAQSAVSSQEASQLGFRYVIWSDDSIGFDDYFITSLYGAMGTESTIGFFLGTSESNTQLDVTQVTFQPDAGTDAAAVTAEQDEDFWWIEFHKAGSGWLVCTANGTKYEIPVQIAMPSIAFATSPSYTTDACLSTFDFHAQQENVVWVVSESGFTAQQAETAQWHCYGNGADSYTDFLQIEQVQRDTGSYDFKVTILQTGMNGISISVTVEYESAWLYVTENLDAPKLATPTNLAWGKSYSDEEELPGYMSALTGSPTQNWYDWEIYRVGEAQPVESSSWEYGNIQELDDIYSEDFLRNVDNLSSGTYYFKVWAVGDGVNYRNSDPAVSDTWTYVKPTAQLAAPVNLYWDGRYACWSSNDASELTYQYEVAFGSIDVEDGTFYSAYSFMGSFSELREYLGDWAIARLDDQICYFRVRALSGDITKALNSPWSELSPGYDLGDVSEQVNQELDQLLQKHEGQESLSAEEKAQLQEQLAENKENLQAAMAADHSDADGTMKKLEELEALTGGPAKTTVAPALANRFDSDKVSIVGANLNTPGDQKATLQIGPADSGAVIPTQYSNTLQFSMSLDGVGQAGDGHQYLDIPVKITLPVPANISPSFLVILHRHQDGSYEELHPYIFQQDGQVYASFVITSFSDFALAEAVPQIQEHTVTLPSVFGASMVMAAVYDSNGRMLQCTTTASVADSATLTLSALSQGATLKLFYLDSHRTPIHEATEIPLK